MSDQAIYFQWQNEVLLNTIYPLREMKLRDFLVFFYEIDTWAQYKPKTMADLKNEEAAYRTSQTQIWAEAYDTTQALKDYFLKPDVTEDYKKKYPDLDLVQMKKINDLHLLFKTYFPKITNVLNERSFLTQRITPWETARKEIVRLISENQRKLRNMGPTWARKAAVEQETKKMQEVTLKMADDELNKLYAFLSASMRIENRRLQLKTWRDQKTKEKGSITINQQKAAASVQTLTAQQQSAQTALNQLKNPPSYEALEAYIAKEDVTGDYQAQLGDIDAEFIGKINQAHRAINANFKINKVDASRVFFLKGQISQLDLNRKQVEARIAENERFLRNMGPTWAKKAEKEQEINKQRRVTLPLISAELSKLNDMLSALTNRSKPKSELDALTAQKEKELAAVVQQLTSAQEQATSLDAQLKVLDSSVGMPEKDLLLNFLGTQPITVKDIVTGKVEAYRKSLEDKNQYELLEIIIRRFKENPTRFPLWLQYMVVHFSGMRYQSAHGSWADPKDLLLALRMKAVEKDLKRADDEAIDALCADKIAIYEPTPGQVADPNQVKPKLAQAQEAKWTNKITFHLRGLKSLSPYQRRKSLMDLRIDEENYDIETMKAADALAALEEMKDDFPEWMWKEIVKLTDLRVKEVTDPNWENLSDEEQEERQDQQMSEFRQVMDEWKKNNLTGWREEHDRTNQLIVTRAVCNEVAEHIQHIRGNSPPGGLTAKPEWYLRQERDPKFAAKSEKPFLVKPRTPVDFKEGSSVLWLSFVNGEPNPWRIAHPLMVRGEGLLSPGLIGGGGGPSPSRPDSPGNFNYTQDSNAIRRSGFLPDAKGQRVKVEQWLRWLHEATVAEWGETADGIVVLTFETALPYEDKRQSTIGVFRHYFDYIKHTVNKDQFIASFTGFTPTGDIPYEDLRFMLDWNKILLKNFATPAEMDAFWRAVGYTGTRALAPVRPATWLEAAPTWAVPEPGEVILCYEVDLKTKTALPYQPEVALKRGMRMKVSLTEIARIEAELFHRVMVCEDEPRAQELYVRKSDCLETSREKAPQFVQAKKAVSLYRLAGAGADGKPQFKRTKVKLEAGMKAQVSGVHQLTQDDAGDGVVSLDGKKGYYLIIACPGRSSAQGLFVRTEAVRPAPAK